ncbi:hypothetical protein [Caballeronia grimmiae]|uniref:hypothetical protein n=1 Tax=Caballeronia grimmiae TaxID=1071679 RepID=UPI0038B962B8
MLKAGSAIGLRGLRRGVILVTASIVLFAGRRCRALPVKIVTVDRTGLLALFNRGCA